MSTSPIILVVDDYEDGRQILGLQLKLCGYRVVTADSVETALALARSTRFDLYILDHCLIDGSGPDLRKRLFELDWRIPAIFHTGRQYDHEEVKALRGDGDEYLPKPAELTVLQYAVAETLRSARERKAS